ncbi:MAG: DUF1385 domain-containing protein [Lachnospiraceae bacterium]|nr:DUF1385 domain-containing protein [Lachnospiraceae bacterium]
MENKKKCIMKYSGIGGQAVMEGIMMRNGDKYAVAVRKPDGDIALSVKNTARWSDRHPWMKWPFIRGTFAFVESMVTGTKTLMYSASFYEVEEGDEKKKTSASQSEKETGELTEVDEQAETEEHPEQETGELTEVDEQSEPEQNPAIQTETAQQVQLSDEEILSLDDEPETDESAPKAASKVTRDEKGGNEIGTGVLVGTLLVSLVFAIGLFALLPVLLASFLRKITDSGFLIALAEGVLRILIFVVYIWAVSRMKDIRRTFMYHGSEHKCINCIEHGLELNTENVRASSKQHKRCGTSFLLIVMIISVFIFMFIRVDNVFLRMGTRILLIPVVAGLSFEFLHFAGSHDGRIINALSKPGLWLQNLTTREPDDDMIEVAITAVEAVFDWREFQKNLGTKPEKACEVCE